MSVRFNVCVQTYTHGAHGLWQSWWLRDTTQL